MWQEKKRNEGKKKGFAFFASNEHLFRNLKEKNFKMD